MTIYISLITLFIISLFLFYKFNKYLNKSPIGGLILLPSILLYIYFSYNNIYVSFFLLCLLLLFLGLLDDLFNLSVSIRFSLVFVFIFVFIYLNSDLIKISSFDKNNLFFLFFFTITVMGFIHTMNMIDGIDGLYISYIFISFIPLAVLDSNLFYFLFFLIFVLLINLNKKIIIGNNGNLYLSAIIPIIFIFNADSSFDFIGYPLKINKELLTILFIIPLIDGLRVTMQRIINSKSPFKKDFSHIQFLNKNDKLSLFVILLTQTFINLLYLTHKNFMITIIISIFLYLFLLLFLKKWKNE